jgi:hypothetical protein
MDNPHSDLHFLTRTRRPRRATQDSSAPQRRASPGASAPGGATGPVNAQEAYVAKQMGGLTASRNPDRGLLKNSTHDTDPDGGLHTGTLNDRPVRAGGYNRMPEKTAQGFMKQFSNQFSKLSPEQRAAWEPADGQQGGAASGNGAGGAAAASASSGPGGISPSSSSGFADAQRDDMDSWGSGPSTQVIAGDPADVGSALRGAAQIEAGQGAGAQQGYGKIGQVASPSQDITRIDASGTRHVTTASGGAVTIPASQPQAPPDASFAASNGRPTGIYKDGIEQVKQPNGTFAPGQSSLSLNAGQPQPAPTDALSRAAGASGPPDAMTASLLQKPDDELDEVEGASGVAKAKAAFPLEKNPFGSGNAN